MSRTRAVVLLSGGLDSATCLAIAKADGHECLALSFNYDQRHQVELDAARRIARLAGVAEHLVLKVELGQLGGSALTDPSLAVPEQPGKGIPITYVPARNTIFLSFALGFAEVREAGFIYIGVNAIDYSGYPDCRPEYIDAFQRMAALATRAGVEGRPVRILAPLQHWSKRQIIERGLSLGVDYRQTISCYQADGQGRACGRCDACRIRLEGFRTLGVADPTLYMS